MELTKEQEAFYIIWKYKSSDALDAETTPGLNVRNDSDAVAKVLSPSNTAW